VTGLHADPRRVGHAAVESARRADPAAADNTSDFDGLRPRQGAEAILVEYDVIAAHGQDNAA
jgi:hypothetical protein